MDVTEVVTAGVNGNYPRTGTLNGRGIYATDGLAVETARQNAGVIYWSGTFWAIKKWNLVLDPPAYYTGSTDDVATPDLAEFEAPSNGSGIAVMTAANNNPLPPSAIFTPPSAGGSPSSPPVVYTPPSAGGSPSAPAAVFTPPGAGGSPSSPPAIHSFSSGGSPTAPAAIFTPPIDGGAPSAPPAVYRPGVSDHAVINTDDISPVLNTNDQPVLNTSAP
jgi:hypothetical protein